MRIPAHPLTPPPAADVAVADIIAALEETLTRRDRAIDGFVTLVAELKADNVAIHARLDRLLVPEQVPDGFIALRVAARMLKKSDEYLRKRAASGAIAAELIGGRWYVELASLAIPNGN
jgi:hypothetical protein